MTFDLSAHAYRPPGRESSPRTTRTAILLFALVLAGCSVKLVSDYDEQVDRTATEMQRRMDSFLTRIEAEVGKPSARYEANAEFYREYLVDLRALRIRAGANEKNQITLEQLDLMESSVGTLADAHREGGEISAAAGRSFRDRFNTSWKAIIEWELAKKRGQG